MLACFDEDKNLHVLLLLASPDDITLIKFLIIFLAELMLRADQKIFIIKIN
jgi:hypothetical protein